MAVTTLSEHNRAPLQSHTESKPRLLFLVTEDWYFASHRLPLALAAQAAGYDVSVATRVRAHGDVIRNAGIRVIPFENARSGLNPIIELWTLLRLIRLYRKERPAVIHHVAMKPVIYGSIAARFAGQPRVLNALAGMGWIFTPGSRVAHGPKFLVSWALRTLLRSGTVLVQNPDDEQLLRSIGVGHARIHRIPGSGVDLKTFRPQPEPPGKPVVILPSRLLWHKGVGEFVAAARRLKGNGIEARFVLAGDPDEANPSSIPPSQIKQWVTEGIVEHLGWVDNMPAHLASSHIVCLPSYREGLPKALVEAAAAGRPIVTTDTPGCREIVRHGDNGLLVPVGAPDALADALESLIHDAALRQRMGARGRARVEAEFSLDAVVGQTLALYEAT